MFLLDLPPELLDSIIGYIDKSKDLLRLALACKLCEQVIIPNHLYTRSLSVHRQRGNIVLLLSQRPVYASRFRTLHITRFYTPYRVLKNLGIPDLGSTIIDNDDASLGSLLEQALPEFSSLVSFSWDTDYTPPVEVLRALRTTPQQITTLEIQYHIASTYQADLFEEFFTHFPHLRHLKLVRGHINVPRPPGSHAPLQVPQISDWMKVANWTRLQSLTLGGFDVDEPTLEAFFARHEQITYVQMPQLHHVAYPPNLRSLIVRAPLVSQVIPLKVDGVTFLEMLMPPSSRSDLFFRVIGHRMPNVTVLKCGATPISWDALSRFPKFFSNLTKLHTFVRLGLGLSLERLCIILGSFPSLTHFASVVPNTEERARHTVPYTIERIASSATRLEFIHIGPDGRDHRLRHDTLQDWYHIQRAQGGTTWAPVDSMRDGVLVDSWVAPSP